MTITVSHPGLISPSTFLELIDEAVTAQFTAIEDNIHQGVQAEDAIETHVVEVRCGHHATLQIRVYAGGQPHQVVIKTLHLSGLPEGDAINGFIGPLSPSAPYACDAGVMHRADRLEARKCQSPSDHMRRARVHLMIAEAMHMAESNYRLGERLRDLKQAFKSFEQLHYEATERQKQVKRQARLAALQEDPDVLVIKDLESVASLLKSRAQSMPVGERTFLTFRLTGINLNSPDITVTVFNTSTEKRKQLSWYMGPQEVSQHLVQPPKAQSAHRITKVSMDDFIHRMRKESPLFASKALSDRDLFEAIAAK